MESVVSNNLKIICVFSDAKANCMTESELALVEEVRQIYLDKTKVPCTACEYCCHAHWCCNVYLTLLTQLLCTMTKVAEECMLINFVKETEMIFVR